MARFRIAAADAAGAIVVGAARLTNGQPTCAEAGANVVAGAAAVSRIERNVGACTCVGAKIARFADARAETVATNAIDTVEGRAFRAAEACRSYAFAAIRSAAIDIRFVTVLHAIAA